MLVGDGPAGPTRFAGAGPFMPRRESAESTFVERSSPRDNFDRGTSTPAAFDLERVWIDAPALDGDQGAVQLAASIDVPAAPPPPWPVVVLFHGFSGHKIGRSYHFVEFGRRLAARGIACVRFDHAGCGESTGDQTRMSLKTIERDGRAVWDWLRSGRRFDASRVALVGSSMGSLGALLVDRRAGARGLVFWAPVFDLKELVEGKVRDVDAVAAMQLLGHVPYRGIRLGQSYFDALGHADAAALLHSGRSPVLIVHSRDDEVVGVAHGRRMAEAARAAARPCEFLELDAATHDFHEEPVRSRMLKASVERIAMWLGIGAPSPAG